MKVLGLDLDNSPLLTENKSLKYALNIEINNKCLSYFNEKGFKEEFIIPKECVSKTPDQYTDDDWDNSNIQICGFINCPENIILFVKISGSVNTTAILSYNTNTNLIDKSYYGSFNFTPEYPIHGIYTYYNNDLIVIYTSDVDELKIINITSFKDNNYNQLEYNDLGELLFIPDNNFTLDVEEDNTNKGSLLTGSYQIAVKFKTSLDVYTSYSSLSETINIYGDSKALKVGSITNRSIKINIQLDDITTTFEYYKIAVIYNNGESQLCYETDDIEINNNTKLEYIISNLNILNLSTLEEILIKNINYAYAKDLSLMNNQLILGNVSKINHFYEDISNFISVEIGCKPIDIETAIQNKKPFFQAGEVYIFYIALFDRKGDLINIHPISYYPFTSEYNDYQNCIDNPITVDNQTFNAHRIPYTVSQHVESPKILFQGDTFVFYDPENNTNRRIRIIYKDTIEREEDLQEEITDTSIKDNITVSPSQTLTVSGREVIIESHVWTNENIELVSDITYKFINNPYYIQNNITWNENYIVEGIETTHTDVSSNAFEICARVIFNPQYHSNVKSYQILYVEHNYNNSRILTQGVIVPDSNIDFKNQSYTNQFNNESVGRLYSFDLLFNKPKSILGQPFKINDLNFDSDSNTKPSYTPVYNWDDEDEELYKINTDGVKIGIMSNQGVNPETGLESPHYNLNLILNNNSYQNNIAGDTYYKIDFGVVFQPISSGLYNIYNQKYKYTSLYNQKLQPATSIKSVDIYKDINYPYHNIYDILKGDTYIDYLTLRITTPAPSYFSGDAQHPERDSNKTVYRWVIVAPLMSKLNINAHYSTNINKVYDLSNLINKSVENRFKDENFIELINLDYTVDHPINNDLDVNYSKVYNETGIEPFIYYKTLKKNYNFPNRIVRSLYQTDESSYFKLTQFKANDYKDLPTKYGEITVINNNDQFLYIHQKHNLSYLSIRDTLTSDQVGSSYLTSSDLFNIEAKSLLYNPTGFISCISKFDTLINETGYYCIDNKSHKIFKINKDSIKDITSENVKYWFKDNLITLEKNNPYNQQGRYLNFDNENNTLYIVQNVIDKIFTLSFNTIVNKWISFHSYQPLIGLNNNSKIYWLNDKRLFVKDKYIQGKYINSEIQNSYFKFVLNPYTTYNKVFKTIVWIDRITDNTSSLKILNKNETFNKIAILTDDQCSDWQILNNAAKWYDSQFGVNNINQWRFNEIWNVAKEIFHTDSPIVFRPGSLTNTKWYKRNKIYDQYIYVIFEIKNGIEQHELIDIDVEFDLDNRNQQLKDKKE